MSDAGVDSSIQLRDGRVLGFSEYGSSDGVPVFYFHGFPGSRLDWKMFDGPAVAESGARVIAIDRPGYGLSDPSPGRTMLAWPADTVELADELRVERFAVLGVSGGGPYALACAAAIPHRVRAVGIVCGMGPADAPGMKSGSSWTIPGKPRILRRPLLSLMNMGLRREPERFVSRSKQSFAEVDAVLLDVPEVADAYMLMLREALRQGAQGAQVDAALYSRPWGFSLGEIGMQVHLWHGVLDENVPVSVGRHVAKAIPDCRATYFDEEGHLTLPRNRIGEILGVLGSGTPGG